MGLELAKAFITIAVDSAPMRAGMSKTRREAIEALRGIGLAANWAFMGAARAIEAMFKSMEEVVSMGARQLEAELRMQAVMKATGEAAGFSAQQLMDYASTIQNITAIEDVRVMEAMAKMATFKNIQGETYKRAIRAATDIERMGFANLNRAAIQLGRSLQDPLQGMEAMTRFGISLGKETRELIKVLAKENRLLEAQEIILSAVEGKMKDVAKMVGMTQMGEYRKLIATISDYKEVLGKDLLPLEIRMKQQQAGLIIVLHPLTALIGKISEATGQWIPNIRLTFYWLSRLSIGLLATAAAMKYFGVTLTGLKLGIGAAFGVGFLVVSFAAILAALQGILNHLSKARGMQEEWRRSVNRFKNAWKEMQTSVKDTRGIMEGTKYDTGKGPLANLLAGGSAALIKAMQVRTFVYGLTEIGGKHLRNIIYAALTGQIRIMKELNLEYESDIKTLRGVIGRMGVELPPLAKIPPASERGKFPRPGGELVAIAEFGRRLQESLLNKNSPEERTAENTGQILKELRTQTDLIERQDNIGALE